MLEIHRFTELFLVIGVKVEMLQNLTEAEEPLYMAIFSKMRIIIYVMLVLEFYLCVMRMRIKVIPNLILLLNG